MNHLYQQAESIDPVTYSGINVYIRNAPIAGDADYCYKHPKEICLNSLKKSTSMEENIFFDYKRVGQSFESYIKIENA